MVTTTGLLLSTQLTYLMPYNNQVSYIFMMIAFGAALFSVVSGTAVILFYESCTIHQDMGKLKVSLLVLGWSMV